MADDFRFFNPEPFDDGSGIVLTWKTPEMLEEEAGFRVYKVPPKATSPDAAAEKVIDQASTWQTPEMLAAEAKKKRAIYAFVTICFVLYLTGK